MTFFSSLWCDTQGETQHRHVIRTEPIMVSHYTTRKKKTVRGSARITCLSFCLKKKEPPWFLYVLRAYVLFEYHTTRKNEPSSLLHKLRTYVLFEYHTTKKKEQDVLCEYHTTRKNESSWLLYVLRAYVLFEYHTTPRRYDLC